MNADRQKQGVCSCCGMHRCRTKARISHLVISAFICVHLRSSASPLLTCTLTWSVQATRMAGGACPPRYNRHDQCSRRAVCLDERVPPSREPETPYGWPTAMAPPQFTFNRSSGIAEFVAGNRSPAPRSARLSSRARCPRPQAARSRSFGIANTGPMPISSGSQPATAKPRKSRAA